MIVKQMGAVFIAIFFATFQTLLCTLYSKRYNGKASNTTPIYCIIEAFIIPAVTVVLYGFDFDLSPVTLLLSLLNGIVLYAYNTSVVVGSRLGSYAFLNVCLLFGGIIVPLVAFAWRDTISTVQYIAIAFMLLGCYLMNADGVSFKKTKPIYYILCAVVFVANGTYTVLLNVQEELMAAQSHEMLALTCFFGGMISLIQLLFTEKKQAFAAFKMDRFALMFLIGSLICVAVGQNVMVTLYAVIPPAILMAFVSGGIIILAALFSRFLFKEKLTVPKILGVIVSAASAVALSL